MRKTVVYSTRIDPQVIASLAHLYDLKKWRYRSASDLINHALTTFKDYLVMLESNKDHGTFLEFNNLEKAVGYLMDNPRLDTVQLMKDFGGAWDRELTARESWTLTEHDKVANIDLDEIESDPAIIKRRDELIQVKRRDPEEEEEQKRKRELLEKQKESAQETK